HRAAHARAHREALGRRRPRIGSERAERQPDAVTPAFRVGLELHDLGLHPLTHLQHVGRVGRTGVAERAHVDQAVDAAEIDERSEVAERRHRARDGRAQAKLGPDRPGLLRGLLLEQLPPRDDDVATARLELRDPEAEALPDVLRAFDSPPVDLRSRAEGAYAPDLDVVAALVLAGDEALDRDPVRERLLELPGDVPAAAGDPLEHDRPRARPVIDDRRLDLVALVELHFARRGVAELAELDRRLGLAPDGDEGRRAADGDHAPADDVARSDTALTRALPLARREERREVLVVGFGHGSVLL